jgi:hypothetical protein
MNNTATQPRAQVKGASLRFEMDTYNVLKFATFWSVAKVVFPHVIYTQFMDDAGQLVITFHGSEINNEHLDSLALAASAHMNRMLP